VTATEKFIEQLGRMKSGELGLLRTHVGQGLDETVDGFDLFTGRWWPLRQENERAPRREVAWLIAKLYAFRPLPQSPGEMLARQLGRCRPVGVTEKRFTQRFDRMLTLPLEKIEPDLRWALGLLASKNLKLDWVKLTDDLSIWERESKRLEWAKQFLKFEKEGCHVN
jgi:CRISPR type I-E-associated protein CasB/Cse2